MLTYREGRNCIKASETGWKAFGSEAFRIIRNRENPIEQRCVQLHGVPIVAGAYTIPNPGTVVVETLNTVVALPAMRGAWGPVHLARSAILELQFLAVDLVIFEAVE